MYVAKPRTPMWGWAINIVREARITSPPPPNLGNLYHFFWTSKTTFLIARITEQSKDDYDNDVSDNCDHNFCT